MCQGLFDRLFDPERVGRSSRPEFAQGVAVAVAPSVDGLVVTATIPDEGNDAVRELANRDRVQRRIIEPVNDECVFATDAFEAFAGFALLLDAWSDST
jgi:hypothetical protein